MSGSKKHEHLFTPDFPLIDDNDDLFNHKDLAEVLREIIENCKPPINIALYGRWGVGKSTILNFLEKRLKTIDEGKKYHFVNIDLWKLSPNIIRQELLETLNDHFGKTAYSVNEINDELYNTKEEDRPITINLKERIRNIVKTWTPYVIGFFAILAMGYEVDQFKTKFVTDTTILAAFGIPISLAIVTKLIDISKSFDQTSKRIIPKAESSLKFEKIFKKIISAKKEKILVMALDNLDRCDDKTVVNVLSTIKTFMEEENCIYVIPCDEIAIIKHLQANQTQFKEEREAKEFLTKFFQITLNVPPQILGDLDNFAGKQMSVFKDVRFDDNVKDVLILGISKNPRKIKQFLYNMVALYKLAQRKEDREIVQRGTITNHTGFLMKMVVLREEWPDFYRKLEMQEDLLDLIQKYFDENNPAPLGMDIVTIFKNNHGLEHFLRTTDLVKVDNIQPFLQLNQEAYERGMSELNNIINAVNERDVNYVTSLFSGADEIKKIDYIKKIIQLNEKHVKNNRTQFAFNSMYVLVELFDNIPAGLKSRAMNTFSTYLKNTKSIRDSLHLFNVDHLFPLIIEMPRSSRDVLLKEYAGLLTRGNQNQKILNYFMKSIEHLSHGVIGEFNLQLRMVGQNNPSEFFKLVKILSKDEIAKTKLIRSDLIEALLQRIEPTLTNQTKEAWALYLEIKHSASDEDKTQFANRVAQILAGFQSVQSINNDLKYVLDAILAFDKTDFSQEGADIIYERTRKLLESLPDENSKLIVIKTILLSFDHLSNSNSKEFIEKYLNSNIMSSSGNFLNQLCQFCESKTINIIQQDSVFDVIISRINQIGPTEEILTYIIDSNIEKRKDQISKIIVNIVRNQPTHYSIISNVISKSHSKLATNSIMEICNAMIQVGKTKSWNEVLPLFDGFAISINSCPDEIKNQFQEIILNWLRDGNFAPYGVPILTKTYSNLPTETKSFARSQIIERLASYFSQNNGNIRYLMDFVISIQQDFDEANQDELIKILNGQISVGAPQLHTVLQYIPQIKFTMGSNLLANSIFKLATLTTENSIKQKCKETIQQFDKSVFSESDIKKINDLFNEQVI